MRIGLSYLYLPGTPRDRALEIGLVSLNSSSSYSLGMKISSKSLAKNPYND